jgi:hypothetical protein
VILSISPFRLTVGFLAKNNDLVPIAIAQLGSAAQSPFGVIDEGVSVLYLL